MTVATHDHPGGTHHHAEGADHDHTRSDHDHSHSHGAEVLPGASGPGSVALDIGGDIGAAVVTTPARLDGREIEIRPEPGEWAGEHVAVRPRELPAGTIHAATFFSLPAGAYRLRVRFAESDPTEVPLEVVGGRVTQVAWPT